MGQLARMHREIRRAFATLGDVAKSITYHEADEVDYTPGSPVTNPSTPHAIKGVFTRFRRTEMDNENIMAGDRRLILDPNEVTWTPKLDDWVMDGSEKWEVKDILTDSRIVPMLHVRRAP